MKTIPIWGRIRSLSLPGDLPYHNTRLNANGFFPADWGCPARGNGTSHSDLGIYRTSSSFFWKFPCISADKPKRAAEGEWEAGRISELRVRIFLESSAQHVEIIGKNRGTEIALALAALE
jgi:hypothetical protein